jgi:hypothetical protein
MSHHHHDPPMDPHVNQELQHERSQQRREEREAARERIAKGETPWLAEAGVMSLVDAVRDLEFPKRIDEVLAQAGDRDVCTSPDVRLPLAYVLPKLDEPAFTSLRSFETAVQRHWAGIRTLENAHLLEESQTMPPGVDID